MRHTHATLLLRKKIDIKIVSKKIRHKRASFTQDYYQHVANDMQNETATAMDELFTVGKAKKPTKSGLFSTGLEKRLEARKKPSGQIAGEPDFTGGVRRTRTADLFDVNEAL